MQAVAPACDSKPVGELPALFVRRHFGLGADTEGICEALRKGLSGGDRVGGGDAANETCGRALSIEQRGI